MTEQNKQRIETLLESYFDATATPAQEQELRELLERADTLPAELEYARMLFGGMTELAAECMPERLAPAATPHKASATAAPVLAPRPAPPRSLRPLVWCAVAAALLVGIYIGVERMRAPYCYIDGVAIYDREIAMQTTIYLDGLSNMNDPDELVNELIDKQ